MNDKPPIITKLNALSSKEKKAYIEGIGRERDNQQKVLSEARDTRMQLQLKSRDRYIDFLQKLGELSLTFGAALIPVIIVTGARKDINVPALAIIGSAVYLTNGILAFWLTKTRIEQDADDAPHVGLEEEIMTYPLIYAKNKIIIEPDNLEYANEQVQTEWTITHQPGVELKKKRPSAWADLLLFNFVVASMLIVGTFWPYKMLWYWIIFVAIVLLMLVLIKLDYNRAVKNQNSLQEKHTRLAKVKSDFIEWRAKKMSGK